MSALTLAGFAVADPHPSALVLTKFKNMNSEGDQHSNSPLLGASHSLATVITVVAFLFFAHSERATLLDWR